MPEDRSVSRAALLELRHERGLIEQGHRFLDEKRMQLARELLHRIEIYEAAIAELEAVSSRGAGSLASAVGTYGLADVEVYPPLVATQSRWARDDIWFLGLSLPETALSLTAGGLAGEPSVRRPLAEEVGEEYQRVAEQAAKVAGMLTALFRLEAEYRRTERSVRALENVVMPEVRQEEKAMEEALAELDQEEAVRVRLFARRKGPGVGPA